MITLAYDLEGSTCKTHCKLSSVDLEKVPKVSSFRGCVCCDYFIARNLRKNRHNKRYVICKHPGAYANQPL